MTRLLRTAVVVVAVVAGELVARIPWAGRAPPPVHPGSPTGFEADEAGTERRAHRALREALEEGPLTILALGPLTNLAGVLTRHPHLLSNVESVVAVMGRRTGHVFHPAEGAGGGILFGHGPVFRDFNVARDPSAVSALVGTGVPIVLVPYDAARSVELGPDLLGRMTASGGPRAWVARRATGWLDHWRDDIGRDGFYPFDLLAAAYVLDPGAFRCAKVRAWTGRDPALPDAPWTGASLLVTQDPADIVDPSSVGEARYCPEVHERLSAALRRTLLLGLGIGTRDVSAALRSQARNPRWRRRRRRSRAGGENPAPRASPAFLRPDRGPD